MVEEDREVLVERDISGRTPLMVAVLEGNDNLVEFLLSKGANVEVVDLSGKSGLKL
jgi:ankyrin repeat protein